MLAVNQASGLHYRPNNHGFVIPTETLNLPLSNLNDFDFNRPQSYDFPEMEMESESAGMYYGDDAQNSTSPANTIPPRIFPGFHTQKANQAKIQQAQKQQEMIKQQQTQLPAGQQQLPTSTPKSPVVKDPHVEESISRLLNRMRQSSNASLDDADSPAGNSNMPRFKKDEEDMDEDERLLNSEEGKKLSSKERRQLRNKVSARAFRSRRKEYIGQLENEVAQKAQEANELRIQNRQLMEENTRLTDLTRMLLSSQSFSGFLQELSQTGNIPTMPQSQAQKQPQQSAQQQTQPQPQPTRKDIPSHEASRQVSSQNHMQVGMTLIPETPIDMSIFDNHSWSHVPSSDFQVYSLTDLPEPPKIDLSNLSEKASESTFKVPVSSKKDLPMLSTQAETKTKTQTVVSRSDDLYDVEETSDLTSITLPTPLYTTISKAAVSSALLASHNSPAGSISDLERMCEELDATCERLSELMS